MRMSDVKLSTLPLLVVDNGRPRNLDQPSDMQVVQLQWRYGRAALPRAPAGPFSRQHAVSQGLSPPTDYPRFISKGATPECAKACV